MTLPSAAQIIAAAKGSTGDMHNTLLLLRSQLAQHVSDIATLRAEVAALKKAK